jgi:N-acetylglucosaminyl-diphospho-decaprenol L-rhamnosyltransferase
MRLLIVIVNYRTAALSIDCLRSLAPQVPQLPAGTRVVVTDNASGDDSVERLTNQVSANGWRGWCEIRALVRNGGFAYGNNEAIRPALQSGDPPDYVLLLNPDTIVRDGAVSALLDFMDAHPNVGIAGSRLEEPDGRPQRSAFRFPGVLSELETGLRLSVASRVLSRFVVAPPPPPQACRVDWVAGASMMIRKAVFDDAGLLDENYFMYYEEVDFCLRASRAGWPCWYVPSSRVVHLVGQSSGVTDERKPKKRRPAYWFESRRRYFVSHFGRARTFLADTFWIVGHALYRATVLARRRPANDPAMLLRDFIRYNFLPAGRRAA